MTSLSRCASFMGLLAIVAMALCLDAAWAEYTVMERPPMDTAIALQRLVNPGFEDGDAGQAPPWVFLEKGYQRVADRGREGSAAVRCSSKDAKEQHGASQPVTLDQEHARPIVASGWSRAENVDGSPNSGYALYLDIDYADGTHLWGQTANFSTGTHDWEYRQCIVLPDKPVKSLTFHALFRGHTGTVYFDDLSLGELPDATTVFEGVPVSGLTPAPEKPHPGGASTAATKNGLSLSIDDVTGRIRELKLNDAPIGRDGCLFFVRDVAADSAFLAPDLWNFATVGEAVNMTGDVDSLGLRLTARITCREDYIDITGKVDNLRGKDRAVTVYFALPLTGKDWLWSDDVRRNRPTEGVMLNTRPTGAGATGTRSWYPLAALTGPSGGLALAVPIDNPRHDRLGYDSATGLFFAAIDLAISEDTAKFANCATYQLLLYPFDAAWKFRAALARYYALFPDAFTNYVKHQGLWMAFTDISTVKGWEDFGFAFHEGTNNVPWDERHDILSFVYTEPMTHWLSLPKEIERSQAGAVDYLNSLAQAPEPEQQARVATTRLSAVRDPEGKQVLGVHDAPWCDGCVFALNPDPDLPAPEGVDNQGQSELARIQKVMADSALPCLAGWATYGIGYSLDKKVFSEGSQSIRVRMATPGKEGGVVQQVALKQTTAKPLVLRASIKAAGLTGEADADCGVYVDLVHTDGTALFAQVLSAPPGTYDFQRLERTIASDKPFQKATVILLIRNNHSGTIWFDDIFLGEADSETNLIENPGLEGPRNFVANVDGTYIDSYEFWATTLNYDRAQFVSVDVPLVFDTHTRRPGILEVFSTFEFQRELARQMRSQGKYMMANGVLANFDFPTAYLDVLGTETNWFPNGKWSPLSDAELCYRRALSYQKPYCFLMNAHYADLGPGDIERYMRRALFYGMFPGFFSENASTECFFENPVLYDAARPLFKKYLPIIQRIAQAGWQPVTYASPSGARVYVERYGDPATGTIYFTVLNENVEPASATITVDLAALGWTGKTVAARDLLADTDLPLDAAGAYAVQLNTDEVHVAVINAS